MQVGYESDQPLCLLLMLLFRSRHLNIEETLFPPSLHLPPTGSRGAHQLTLKEKLVCSIEPDFNHQQYVDTNIHGRMLHKRRRPRRNTVWPRRHDRWSANLRLRAQRQMHSKDRGLPRRHLWLEVQERAVSYTQFHLIRASLMVRKDFWQINTPKLASTATSQTCTRATH